MLVFLRYIGEAFAHEGLRVLAGTVPLGSVIYDLASRAVECSRRDKRYDELRSEIERTMQASSDEVRQSAKAIASEVLAGQPEDQVLKLEHYLTQIPSVARQSMRRQADPSGMTLANGVDPRDPSQLGSLLPQRLPRFHAGEAVPNSSQWQFVDLLGAGGFGEVWLARNKFVDQLRAFKFCLDDAARERLLKHEGEVVKRVMAESQSERNSKHGIVPLLDAYLEGETPWLAYEYVSGGDLAAIIRDSGKLAPGVRGQRMLKFLVQLAKVIGRFHNFPQPIVHRDLKPANILWQIEGRELVMRVTDFGISQLAATTGLQTGEGATPNMSRSETLRGTHTPIYASPQQKRGLPPDVRDDVHALGIIGYQLLLGDLSAERPAGRWRKRLGDVGLSDAALDLLESCWDDDPNERPANAQVLADRIAEVLRSAKAKSQGSAITSPPAVGTSRRETAPPLPKTSVEPFLKILAEEYAEFKDEKAYIHPNIPEEKLSRALKSFGGDVSNQAVLLLYDDTLFGGCREGIILTADRICWKNIADSPKSLPLTDLNQVTGKEGFLGNEHVLINHEKISTGGQKNRGLVIARVIQRFAEEASRMRSSS